MSLLEKKNPKKLDRIKCTEADFDPDFSHRFSVSCSVQRLAFCPKEKKKNNLVDVPLPSFRHKFTRLDPTGRFTIREPLRKVGVRKPNVYWGHFFHRLQWSSGLERSCVHRVSLITTPSHSFCKYIFLLKQRVAVFVPEKYSIVYSIR